MELFRALLVLAVLLNPSVFSQRTREDSTSGKERMNPPSSERFSHNTNIKDNKMRADGDEKVDVDHQKTSVPQNSSEKIITIHIDTTTEGLYFPVPPGILVMVMDSQRVFKANYSLLCPKPHVDYVLEASLRQLFHQRTAVLSAPVSVNISCHPGQDRVASLENDTEENGDMLVSGSFNISISSGLLGKAVLLFFLREVHDEKMTNGTNHLESQEGTFRFHGPETVTRFQTPTKTSVSITDVSSSSVSPSSRNVVYRAALLVVRPYRLIDVIFRITTYVIIVAVTVGMGCKTDVRVVKDVLRKPSAPAIGFFCQYVCMPLIAYGVARGVDVGNALVSFGIFACGVCPGGGASNMYSYLLGGDLSLSVTLTIISTIASLAMIPFWFFTLGATIDTGGVLINIPYLKIAENLAKIILPLFVGLFLQYRFPRVAKLILKILKPVFLVAILFMLSVGIYANFYIFRLFEPLTILAGCMLPYIGYVVGGLVALVLRQPWPRVKTIALETGIQNVGVAFLILIFSLPTPEGELAAVGPAASAIMTGLPPLLLSIGYVLYNKVKAKGSHNGGEEKEDGKEKKRKEEEKEEEEVEEKKEKDAMLENEV